MASKELSEELTNRIREELGVSDPFVALVFDRDELVNKGPEAEPVVGYAPGVHVSQMEEESYQSKTTAPQPMSGQLFGCCRSCPSGPEWAFYIFGYCFCTGVRCKFQ